MHVEGGSPQRKVFWDGQRGYAKLISLESSNCVLAVDNSGVTVDSREEWIPVRKGWHSSLSILPALGIGVWLPREPGGREGVLPI